MDEGLKVEGVGLSSHHNGSWLVLRRDKDTEDFEGARSESENVRGVGEENS